VVKAPRTAAARLKRVLEIVRSLPDVQVKTIGHRREHRSFLVRAKTIGYYLFDHHGDGRIALWCKAAPGEQGRFVEEDPDRFFVPPYLGPRGWLGLRLDGRRVVDWAVVTYLMRNAYRLTASRSQVARME